MTDPDDTTPAFSRLLLQHRQAAGLSQADLARASGVSVRSLRELERGRASAAQERPAQLLATALGLTGDQRMVFLTIAKEGRRRTTRPVDARMLHALPVVSTLVGRERELRMLSEEAEAGGVVVVVGLPGVGKTSVAVSAARRLAADFPDGCLALDLGGAGDRPVSPRAALKRMLSALGLPTARIPAGQADRLSLFRTLVRGRRLLVLLDNAVDEEQVRSLLGTGKGSMTIVTSRNALSRLQPARRLALAPLPSVAAVELIASIAGEQLVREDPQAALELASLCGNLPLAVRIAGNRLATQPNWTLPYLVRQLRDERMRLTSLSAGDWQVRSAFEVSFRRLPASVRKVFQRLAVIPGADFGEELAAVATGIPLVEVGKLLDELVDASLLNDTVAEGRLCFHDLIRIFAAESFEAAEPQEDRDRLRDVLYTYVFDRAIAAGRLLFPGVLEAPPDGPFRTRVEAQEWLELEGSTWAAVQRVAADLGWHREALELARSLHWYADSAEGEYGWDEVFAVGVRSARALGDRTAEVDMLNQLGWAQGLCRNENELALATSCEALELAEEENDHRGLVFAHGCLGTALTRLGRGEEGLAHIREACELAAEYGFFDVQLPVRDALGAALGMTGRHEEALAVHRALIIEMDQRRDEVHAEMWRWATMVQLENVALCLVGLERWREAAKSHHCARLLSEASETSYHEAEQAVEEGVAWREAGEYDLARRCLVLARDLLDGPVYQTGRARVDAEIALLPGRAQEDTAKWPPRSRRAFLIGSPRSSDRFGGWDTTGYRDGFAR